MKKDRKPIWIVGIILIACMAGCYLIGLIAQLISNYADWLGDSPESGYVKPISWNPSTCIGAVFTKLGLKICLILGMAAVTGYLIFKLYNRFGNKQYDSRGFTKSKYGTYGTAAWLSEKELKNVFTLDTPDKVEGIIVGEHNGKVVAVPKDTNLNRHVAVFGASGTMKSRAIIRNALFQALRQGESVVVTDPKGEMYEDTAELYRQNGYEVKVYNLVDPTHSDSWNCMSDLHGDTLLAQVLTNVIIGNTSSGKSDHFWDNGEGNLLKALILYVDLHEKLQCADKHLSSVYQLLVGTTESNLNTKFSQLRNHPAQAPYNLYSQSSDTVRSGIKLGLGTRLQVLQNEAVMGLTSRSDIDLTLPAKKKCAYYVILSDQDATMSFLSSLFFSFLFIKLTRYADARPNRRCDLPVNLILDEFNNVGRIGGAEDGSDFARSLSVCRSRDIRVTIAVQSLGQLQNRYPNNLWSEIVGNCDIQLMLGCTDEVTAKYFSDRSGDMSVEVSTTMTNRKTFALAQLVPQYRYSEGLGRRKLMTPDEVLRLNPNELLCVIRGQNLVRLNKWDYTNHPVSAHIKKKSVYEYQGSASPSSGEGETTESVIREGEVVEADEDGVLFASMTPPENY